MQNEPQAGTVPVPSSVPDVGAAVVMGGPVTGRDGPASRGQIVLITVVVLSTLFVALALLLNSAIYTENLSTRGTTDSDDAVAETAGALETVDELIDRTNRHHNATHETATENLTSMVDAVAAVRRAEAAKVGAHSHVAIVDQTNGTHVRQVNDSREFTNASGTRATGPSWRAPGASATTG